MNLLVLAISVILTTPAAARAYTGFNHGAFWSDHATPKRYADFHQGFELARNLTDTPVPFDSARLYTCITAGTTDDPTEAFQAAIDTGTNLLLGMWISPGVAGESNAVQVDNELAALGKAFERHGQKLADLVVGLLVGSEDVYRFGNAQAGVDNNILLTALKTVRDKIATSTWARYIQGKPIGHTDTTHYAVVPGSDFVAVTGYPYWEGTSIDHASTSFLSLLSDTQRRAGTTPLWIAEMGWPINGATTNDAVPSAENYQRYWAEVGCQVFGKYNTFWFELLQDSQPDQPGWGLLDAETHQPRISDLNCGTKRSMSMSAATDPLGASNTVFNSQSTFSTVYVAKVLASISPSLWNQTTSLTQWTRTVHTTLTLTTTAAPSSMALASLQDIFTLHPTTLTSVSPTLTTTAAPPLTSSATNSTNSNGITFLCITMMDLIGDGTVIPVAIAPSTGASCAPPPRFTGSPLTQIEVSAGSSSSQKSSFDLYAPSSAFPLSPTTASTHSSVLDVANGPTCVTSVGQAWEAVVVEGVTYFGRPTASCSTEGSAVSTTSSTISTPVATSSTLNTAPTETPVSSTLAPTSFTTMDVATTKRTRTEGQTVCVTPNGTPYRAVIRSGLPRIQNPLVECTSSPVPSLRQ